MKPFLAPLGAWPLLLPLVMALPARAGEDPTQRWALLIGVDDYAELEDLKYAGADVRALQGELLARGFEQDGVFLVEDGSAQSKYRPSKGNIERQLDLLMQLAERDDLLLIAFSGHGVHVEGKSYLCPSDAVLDDVETLVSLDAVYERLRKCPASLKLMLVDACRDDPRLAGRRGAGGADVTTRFAADLEHPPQGIVILNSCAPGQASMEEKEFGHGVFMHFLIEGLHGGADDNRDGLVTLGELSQFAGLRTNRYVARQFNGVQTPKLQGDLATDALAFDLGGLRRATAKDDLGRPPRQGEGLGRSPYETIRNSIGMKLTLIPAGEFTMGSDETEAELKQAFEYAGNNDDEHPEHRVRITKPFFMGVNEVTLGEFLKFYHAAKYRCECERDGKGGWGFTGDMPEQRRAFTPWDWGFSAQTQKHPVVNVTWNDATAFCQWLSKQEGEEYRLPTEAEWEYACRAGTTTRFYNGDDPEGLVKIGNVPDGTLKQKLTWWPDVVKSKDGYAFTAPGGRFRANAFGLYDMTGNAMEWCADWYGANYYENSPSDDPQGPAAGSFRVIRGGGWRVIPVYCRSACRFADEPAHRYNYIGFRVVRAR
ncbi:MAG TPA: SUMF1/EgtB/PvdO family nonheme iron enzyme [Pirellulales bacterium]|nr:SUMF1/EgtB/PvdO family nonheme iron enzyme [Pirellulales bacterium]